MGVSGRMLSLEVEACDTVEVVRDKVQDKGGITPDQRRILFHGVEMEDGKTLKDYSVVPESVLQLALIIRPELIFVATLTRKTLSIQIEDGETIESVKNKIEE